MTGLTRSRHAFPCANPRVDPGANPVPRDSRRNNGAVPRRLGAARVGDGVLGEGGATPSGSRSPLAPFIEKQVHACHGACSSRVTTDAGMRATAVVDD